MQTDRKVVAIYSGNADEPAAAFRALESLGHARVTLLGADGSARGWSVKGSNRGALPEAALRFDGESLIVAMAALRDVPAIVNTLSKSGSPAVFVLQEDRVLQEEQQAAPQPENSTLLARLKRGQAILEAARTDLLEATRLRHPLTAAAEWILDNPYLIRTQVNEVRRHLPRDYAKLLGVNGGGDPRAFSLARDLAARTDFAIDQGNLSGFLTECQRENPLRVAELWLFPLLLRLALIEALAVVLAQAVSRSQHLRELACLWANRLGVSSRADPALFDKTLELLSAEPRAREPTL